GHNLVGGAQELMSGAVVRQAPEQTGKTAAAEDDPAKAANAIRIAGRPSAVTPEAAARVPALRLRHPASSPGGLARSSAVSTRHRPLTCSPAASLSGSRVNSVQDIRTR